MVNSGNTPSAREFNIRLLPPEAAGDSNLMSTLAGLVNDVYADAEEGLWAEGTARTTTIELARFTRAGEFAVASQGDRPLGCVRVRKLGDDACELSVLAVAPIHRGTGIGRELVRFAEQRARERGCGTIRLDVLVPFEWKHPSKEFLDQWYRRMGYDVTGTGRVADYYQDLFPLLATPCGFRIYQKDIRPAAAPSTPHGNA
jgi:GNAT superfamily N-acetyltransferase